MNLDVDQIEAGLAGGTAWNVRVIAETASTNTTLLDWGKRGMRGPVALFAESQTGGRGRRGRQWHAAPGDSLIGSVLLHPDVPPERWGLITLATGVALADALADIAPVRLKWPNDLFLDGKKLGGILVETQISSTSGGFVVIGFGINIHQSDFSADIADRAVSLAQITRSRHDLNEIAAAALNALAEWLTASWESPQRVLDRFSELDTVSGRTITAHEREGGDPIEGTANGIDGQGRLILRLPSGGFRALEDAWDIRW